MKLTTKGRYAVTAMLDLALHTQGKSIPLLDIAKRQGISLSYLEQIFSQLRKAELVTSSRGPGGGYQLALPAANISAGDVIEAINENLDVTRCGGAMNCQDHLPCLTHDLWMGLNQTISDYLFSASLATLMQGSFVQGIASRQDNPQEMPNIGESPLVRVVRQ